MCKQCYNAKHPCVWTHSLCILWVESTLSCSMFPQASFLLSSVRSSNEVSSLEQAGKTNVNASRGSRDTTLMNQKQRNQQNAALKFLFYLLYLGVSLILVRII